MFALRASCSSVFAATRRCPSLVARLSQNSQETGANSDSANPAATDAISFLEDPDTQTGSGATPFEIPEGGEMDGPPTAAPRSFPKTSQQGHIRLSSSKADLPEYKLHCHSSRNNTIVTFTKPDGSTIAWFSGGSTESKFRKGNRATYEAGYQCAKSIFQKIRVWNSQHENIRLEVFFKGYGEGREAMKTALMAVEGEDIRPLVFRVTDRTPIKIGGTRAKKTRRG